MSDQQLPHVVIVGAGFGGLNAAQALEAAPVRVTLIDRRNYHLFQPLLYQVATAGVSPTEIAYPVRAIFRRQKNLTFRMAEVTSIDFRARQVETSQGPLPYDYLILAVGSESNFFGIESVAQNGFDLKDLDDAEAIRNHILRVFELAAQETDPRACQALYTFVVVGGGPTGVECAGAVSELVHLVLTKDFPNLHPSEVKIYLLEMMDRLLAGFPEELATAAEKTLAQKGVEVRLNTAVSGYEGSQVTLKEAGPISAATLIWAAGVKAASLISTLDLDQGRQGRVLVEPTLQLPAYPEVFVVGDAVYLEEEGQPLPMVAPVAIQQGKTAARSIQRMVEGQPALEFDYKDPGSLATIGRNAAVARIGRYQFRGFLAWVVWLVVHLFWLIGFRNRLLVLINWMWDYFLYERAVRLITPRQ